MNCLNQTIFFPVNGTVFTFILLLAFGWQDCLHGVPIPGAYPGLATCLVEPRQNENSGSFVWGFQDDDCEILNQAWSCLSMGPCLVSSGSVCTGHKLLKLACQILTSNEPCKTEASCLWLIFWQLTWRSHPIGSNPSVLDQIFLAWPSSELRLTHTHGESELVILKFYQWQFWSGCHKVLRLVKRGNWDYDFFCVCFLLWLC